MKKFFRPMVVGIALIAVLAFSAMAVASTASATIVTLLAEWLVGGNAVFTTLLVEATGTLLLTDLDATLGLASSVLCSGVLVGTIGPTGEGEVTELLSLSLVAVNHSALTVTALLCDGQEGCNAGTGNDEVWAINFPWLTLAVLVEEAGCTGFADGIVSGGAGNPGWAVNCGTALGTVQDTCTVLTGTEGGAELKNLAGGVEPVFSEAFTLLMERLNANCTLSSEEGTGVVEGSGEITSSEGVLSISSGGAAIATLLAEWLVGGNAVSTILLVEATGTLEFASLASLGIEVAFLCSIIFDGTIGPNGEDEITELLNLNLVKINPSALSVLALLCDGQKGCNIGTETEVWAVNLPWLTLAVLVEEVGFTGFADGITPHAGGGGEPGWTVNCRTAFGTVQDTCSVTEGEVELKNSAGGVEEVFAKAFTSLMERKNLTCSLASEAESGTVTGPAEIVSSEGTLSISSTG